MRRRRRGPVPDVRLLVLLLPDRLERMADRPHAESLLAAPGAVAVEPAALGYRSTSRMPAAVRDRIAHGQARRMRLPGHPAAVAAYEAAQYPLARALLAYNPEAELWYGGSPEGDLGAAATTRAALTFSGGDPRRCSSAWSGSASRAAGSARSACSPASGSSSCGRAAGRRC